jgi:hypothetical protein
LKTKIPHYARFASVLAVLMLGIGSCCCQGALISGLLPLGKGCCEKPLQPASQHEDCHCAGKILTEGKVDTVSGLPSAPKAVGDHSDVFQPDGFSCAPLLLRSVPAVAHAPPWQALRSLLQVWLI